jgi:23S rRNA pseudouridine2605 synthase
MTQAGVIPKVYHVKLSGEPAAKDLDRLRRGLYLDNERLAPCTIEPLRPGAATSTLKKSPNPWYEVTLHQGRNQQIRRMFHVIGHPVEKLHRVRIGFLEDRRLRPGKWRYLTEDEVQRFQQEWRGSVRSRLG